MTEAKTKNAPVSAVDFIKAVVEGRKAGKSNKEIAEALGMNPASFGVRVSTEGNNLFCATSTYRIGSGKSARELPGHELAAELKVPVGKLKNAELLAANKVERIKDGRTLPGSTGRSGPRSRTNWSEIADNLFGDAE